MTEQWIQVTIKPVRPRWYTDGRETICKVIHNLVTKLEEMGVLQSFHLFHEYGNIELRLCTEYGNIEDMVSEYLSQHDDVIEEFFTCGYEAELEQYGTDGWPIARTFFEACSRFVLTEFCPRAELGDWYSIGKIAHCLMNQYFADRNREAQYHADELCTLIASGYSLNVHFDKEWQDSVRSAWSGCGWKGKWNWEAKREKRNYEEGNE